MRCRIAEWTWAHVEHIRSRRVSSGATACLDGNEAPARIVYAFSEILLRVNSAVVAELADGWTAVGRPHLWTSVVDVVEMQSEGGTAEELRGAMQKGAVATESTASRVGPAADGDEHVQDHRRAHDVSARRIAPLSQSIFSDPYDVTHSRTTGSAMVAAARGVAPSAGLLRPGR